jgi:hypothetical protein
VNVNASAIRTGAPYAFATFFVVVQFYTSLAALSPTPPVGYLFVSRPVAALLVALLALAALVASFALRLPGPPVAGSSKLLLAAWIGPAAVSALFGFDPRSGLEVVAIMLLAGLFHLGLLRCYALPGVARALFLAYLGTGIFAIAGALAMFALHRPGALYALNHGRAAGFFVTANQFASYLIAFGFVALGVALAARQPLFRSLGWAGTVLAAPALVLTFSRSGWLGALAGGLFLAAALRARLILGGLAAAAAGGLALFLVRPFARHDPADTFNRLATLAAGARVAALFPLTGVGPMAYWRVYPGVKLPSGAPPGTFGALHPHDVYVSLAGETGALGIAGCLLGWLAFVRTVRGGLAVAPPAARRLTLAICAGLVATLVQGLFDTIGIVQMTFVWIPYTALALAAAEHGLPVDGPSE